MKNSIFFELWLKQLENDANEFEDSNALRLHEYSKYSNAENEEQDDVTISENDANISSFFRQSGQSLGLGVIDSPKKDFRVPNVPVEFGGASETFDILPDTSHSERRDTVSTIKSLSNSYFETTTNWNEVHRNLKNGVEMEELSTSALSSVCLKQIEVNSIYTRCACFLTLLFEISV